jgi:amidophosphoribosyltransferase (EC 2.4.2.14)
MHLVAKYMNGGTPEEAIAKACSRIQGSYSLLFMVNQKLIAVRDPWGFRPLSLGRVGDAYVLASETCAFDLLEAEYLRCLGPGRDAGHRRRPDDVAPLHGAGRQAELLHFRADYFASSRLPGF